MKINSTIKLTLLLLVAMSAAGTASAYLAYRAGYQALQGVNQPDINPTKKLTDIKKTSTKPVKFKPIDEKTILIKVYNRTHRTEKAKTNHQSVDEKGDKDTETKETKQSLEQNTAPPDNSQTVANFPKKVEDNGVSLEVKDVKNQGNIIALTVNLKNEGTESIKFLYSFLEVSDNQGNSLSAVTEGLPEELPANRENFQGIIKIPATLVHDAQTLSLNLTDYPY